jgi:hypothetical protein
VAQVRIDISFDCKCGSWVKKTMPCPEPNYMAERNRDSHAYSEDSIECEECGESYEVSIMNSFGGADVSVNGGNVDVNFNGPYYDNDDSDDEGYWREEPSEQLRIFHRHLDSAQELLKLDVGPNNVFSLNVMIYGHVVAATEGFLSSVFIKTTVGSEELIRRLLETDPEFSEMKFSMSQLFEKREGIKDTVAGYLQKLIFHDLKKIKPMYKSVLGHDLGDISWLFKAVSKRHDCVHRAGYGKDEKPLTFDEDEVAILIQDVRNMCQSVMDSVTKLEENQSNPF